jgi:hypothetical protein
MKHVLVTAGTVYGRLDDNKLVGNRIRGVWATRFSRWLASRGYSVTLLLPDTFDKVSFEQLMRDTPPTRFVLGAPFPTFDVRYQTGYTDYAAQCYELAPKVDAAVMAAAVVNWIPKSPIKGKMPTDGFAEGAEQLIPFILAPRVIDRMKKLNPKLTLIGCKMTSGAEKLTTLKAAYQTLLKAHCNVVVANDLSRLKHKMLVYPDGNAEGMLEGFEQFYQHLEAVITDEHYHTEKTEGPQGSATAARDLSFARAKFDSLCAKYRHRFVKRGEESDRVFGAIAVRIDDHHWLVSPREKGFMFSSEEAVIVTSMNTAARVVFTVRGQKATLNAPLLLRVMDRFKANAVIHLHEESKDWPTLPYAPPGTERDNNRTFETPAFNIDGHGCVFVEI